MASWVRLYILAIFVLCPGASAQFAFGLQWAPQAGYAVGQTLDQVNSFLNQAILVCASAVVHITAMMAFAICSSVPKLIWLDLALP